MSPPARIYSQYAKAREAEKHYQKAAKAYELAKIMTTQLGNVFAKPRDYLAIIFRTSFSWSQSVSRLPQAN